MSNSYFNPILLAFVYLWKVFILSVTLAFILVNHFFPFIPLFDDLISFVVVFALKIIYNCGFSKFLALRAVKGLGYFCNSSSIFPTLHDGGMILSFCDLDGGYSLYSKTLNRHKLSMKHEVSTFFYFLFPGIFDLRGKLCLTYSIYKKSSITADHLILNTVATIWEMLEVETKEKVNFKVTKNGFLCFTSRGTKILTIDPKEGDNFFIKFDWNGEFFETSLSTFKFKRCFNITNFSTNIKNSKKIKKSPVDIGYLNFHAGVHTCDLDLNSLLKEKFYNIGSSGTPNKLTKGPYNGKRGVIWSGKQLDKGEVNWKHERGVQKAEWGNDWDYSSLSFEGDSIILYKIGLMEVRLDLNKPLLSVCHEGVHQFEVPLPNKNPQCLIKLLTALDFWSENPEKGVLGKNFLGRKRNLDNTIVLHCLSLDEIIKSCFDGLGLSYGSLSLGRYTVEDHFDDGYKVLLDATSALNFESAGKIIGTQNSEILEEILNTFDIKKDILPLLIPQLLRLNSSIRICSLYSRKVGNYKLKRILASVNYFFCLIKYGAITGVCKNMPICKKISQICRKHQILQNEVIKSSTSEARFFPSQKFVKPHSTFKKEYEDYEKPSVVSSMREPKFIKDNRRIVKSREFKELGKRIKQQKEEIVDKVSRTYKDVLNTNSQEVLNRKSNNIDVAKFIVSRIIMGKCSVKNKDQKEIYVKLRNEGMSDKKFLSQFRGLKNYGATTSKRKSSNKFGSQAEKIKTDPSLKISEKVSKNFKCLVDGSKVNSNPYKPLFNIKDEECERLVCYHYPKVGDMKNFFEKAKSAKKAKKEELQRIAEEERKKKEEARKELLRESQERQDRLERKKEESKKAMNDKANLLYLKAFNAVKSIESSLDKEKFFDCNPTCTNDYLNCIIRTAYGLSSKNKPFVLSKELENSLSGVSKNNDFYNCFLYIKSNIAYQPGGDKIEEASKLIKSSKCFK